MKTFRYLLVAVVFSLCPLVNASSELDLLLRCHEALVDKVDAQTQKLSDQPTPFALVSGKKVFFYTHDSGAILEKDFAGKTLTVQLTEQNKPFFRTLSFKGNGELASISFQEPSLEQKKQSVIAKDRMDPGTLEVLKKELIRQVGSASAQYQNRYDAEGTLAALSICAAIPSPEMHKAVKKQSEYFNRFKKRSDAKKSYGKDPATQR
ncbi:MAG: hypothetical protein HUU57_10740 [Bdellovibrio sp.]|nr:hypothetical protein [Bdellovibrio sp.]